MTADLAAVALGLAAGVVSGLLGVGGGVLFVPTLLAILPTVAAGAWRQHRYGNVRWRPALVIGVTSVAGVVGGVLAAEALPELALRRLFAVFLIAVGAQIALRAVRESS